MIFVSYRCIGTSVGRKCNMLKSFKVQLIVFCCFFFPGTKIVSVGKCSYPGLEKKLLQTISNLPDTQGGVMLPSTVQYVIDEINGCSTQKR